jgi:hypothetical protein
MNNDYGYYPYFIYFVLGFQTVLKSFYKKFQQYQNENFHIYIHYIMLFLLQNPAYFSSQFLPVLFLTNLSNHSFSYYYCNGQGTGFLTRLVAVVEQKAFGGYRLIRWPWANDWHSETGD